MLHVCVAVRPAAAGIFSFIYGLTLCFVLMQARKKIRHAYQIKDEVVCCCEEDCCYSFCCQYCAISQVLRHLLAGPPPRTYDLRSESVVPV